MEKFVHEQIKDKPVNKKKIKERVIVSAMCGGAFALVASLVFALLLPGIIRNTSATTDGTEVAKTTEISKETEKNNLAKQSDTKDSSDTSKDTKDSTKDIIYKSLSIDDYQTLQDSLYTIGNQGNKSIVTVNSVKNDVDWFNKSYESKGKACGVIMKETSSELLILTEKKSLGDFSKMSVTFRDNSVVSASLKQYDGNTGIAIISVNKSSIKDSVLHSIAVAEIGNSATVHNGMIVLALGSPLGSNYSILTGNITSTENEISTKDRNYSVFTTDIVGSKNGTGILVDVRGRIVGILMQNANFVGANNTLTALAITDVKPVLDLLIDGKEIPYLGTYVTTATESIAKEYDIPTGVYIKEVEVDSPAMVAGLQSGDVITEINGEAVSTESAFNKKLFALESGKKYPITVKRQGSNGYSEVTCKVKVGVLE